MTPGISHQTGFYPFLVCQPSSLLVCLPCDDITHKILHLEAYDLGILCSIYFAWEFAILKLLSFHLTMNAQLRNWLLQGLCRVAKKYCSGFYTRDTAKSIGISFIWLWLLEWFKSNSAIHILLLPLKREWKEKAAPDLSSKSSANLAILHCI